MIEKLIDLLMSGWNIVAPFVVVDASRNAGVLRFGKYHRTLEPGFYWKWPLIEKANEQSVAVTTLRLPAQTLTTLDRRAIVVSAIVRYEIRDIKPYICEVWDAVDVLADVTMGAIRKAIGDQDYENAVTNPPERQVLEILRSRVNQYGFKVHEVTFTDLAAVRSIRLIQDHAKDLAN